MPDRVLSSSTRKICMSCTAFLIRYNSLYLIAALLPASSFRYQTVISVGKQVFIELIVYLFKGISSDKNALVTFSGKAVLLLLKKHLQRVWD